MAYEKMIPPSNALRMNELILIIYQSFPRIQDGFRSIVGETSGPSSSKRDRRAFSLSECLLIIIILRAVPLIVQSTFRDDLSFDPFSFRQNRIFTPEVDVSRGQVLQALMVSPTIVVIDEHLDLLFKIARQKVILQHYPALQCLVPAFLSLNPVV